MNKLIILLLLPILSHSQSMRFYHYVGLTKIENDFVIVEKDYKLYMIKDIITMSFTRIDLDEGYMWYCDNIPLLELEIIKDGNIIIQLVFYDEKKKLFYKYFKKGERL